MINIPTTLILGAGAAPSGFPLGEDLRHIIIGKLSDPVMAESDNWYIKLAQVGIHDMAFIRAFRKCLDLSHRHSIDSFLEYRPEYMEIGKICIALALIPYENPAILNKAKDTSWYRYLLDCLLTDPYSFPQNRLSIVSFNYDRSLEYYLFTTLQNTYGINEKECIRLLSFIPIVHVHGKLGALPWQGSVFFREYKNDLEFPKIAFEASKQIIVISEKISKSPEFDEAYSLFEKSKRIFILGFGYHDKNIERLRLGEFRDIDIRGTVKDYGRAQISQLFSKWQFIKTCNPSYDINAFFREVISLS